MRIYLWNKDDWRLYDSEKKRFKKELSKRNILIGDSATIGDFATIGDSAKIGDSATIGYFATIGDSAKIGDFATILQTPDIFSELNILLKTGICMQNGSGIFYKAVTEDLRDFYTQKYQYKIGKGDSNKLKQNQNINCGEGWHFANFWEAIKFLNNRKGHIVSAEIKQKDILSVHKKVRVKAFSNIQIVKIDGLIK